MSEQNKAVVRRWVEEFWNKGNVDLAEELFDPGWVNHAWGRDEAGIESTKQAARRTRASIPDLHMTIDDMVAEGDKVAAFITMTGTHKGEIWGFKPTGKKFSFKGSGIRRFTNGKMVEGWGVSDWVGLMRQLGVDTLPQM